MVITITIIIIAGSAAQSFRLCCSISDADMCAFFLQFPYHSPKYANNRFSMAKEALTTLQQVLEAAR
jgi:hypothetical protein